MPYHFKLATPFASEFSHKRDLTRHAEKFFETHQEFGIRDASKELSLFKSHSDPHFPERRTLHFRQQVRGTPVFGAALKVHMDEQAQITMVDGNFVPDLAKKMKNVLSMEPIDIEVAKTVAIEFAKAEIATGVDESWQVISANLSIYREGLFNGRPGDNHFTWLCIVVNSERPNVKEQIFVEAISGKVIKNIPLIHNVQGINRQAWNGVYNQGSPFWNEGDSFPTSSSEANFGLIAAKNIYDMFINAFNYRSYDNQNARMIYVFDLVDVTNTICPNAFWDGRKINACNGLAREDIIGHEWGHAYDEHTANLVYQDQSGALNEALADIVGETLQQLFGNSSPVRPDRSCFNGNRWIIGDEAPAFPGGLRDMYNPNCLGQPSHTQDSQFAYCGDQDNGGVHTNSGVANQFYSLLVDGGSLNSQTVQGIGFFKGFHIVMRAMMVHMTPSSDFPAFGTAVLNSCNELQGVNLRSPVDGTLSGQTISAADCQSVVAASLATRLAETICHAFPPTYCALDANDTVFCDKISNSLRYKLDRFEYFKRG